MGFGDLRLHTDRQHDGRDGAAEAGQSRGRRFVPSPSARSSRGIRALRNDHGPCTAPDGLVFRNRSERRAEHVFPAATRPPPPETIPDASAGERPETGPVGNAEIDGPPK
jgi:hypothetical protein